MSVAKSYTQYKIDGEPFIENGKSYVNIVMPRGLKRVRWYPEANDTINRFSQKHAFGFDRGGYITVFSGDEELIKDWRLELPEWTIWHNTFFGYFMPPYNHIEGERPNGIKTIKFFWEDVHDENDKSDKLLKSPSYIIQYIGNLFSEEHKNNSNFQGAINEWIERSVKIIDKENTETRFGHTHTYTMQDSNDNIYVWTTSSKDLEENNCLSMRMKVKDHKNIQGINRTIVYYWKII